MELSTTGILSLLQTTKEQRGTFVSDVISRIKNGEFSPVLCHLQLKCMEALVEDVVTSDEYKELLLEEAAKHGKTFEMYNGKFQIKEAGTKYDYSVCEDVVYNELMSAKAELDAKIKERQKFLQNIPENGIADPDNGNMIYRAAKSSTTTVTVTLK